jgi:hypothetical protein
MHVSTLVLSNSYRTTLHAWCIIIHQAIPVRREAKARIHLILQPSLASCTVVQSDRKQKPQSTDLLSAAPGQLLFFSRVLFIEGIKKHTRRLQLAANNERSTNSLHSTPASPKTATTKTTTATQKAYPKQNIKATSRITPVTSKDQQLQLNSPCQRTTKVQDGGTWSVLRKASTWILR